MAKITGTSSKNGYGFYAILTETLGENYLSTNASTVKYEVYIVNGNIRTNSSGWTFNAKIDGTNAYNKTSQSLVTNDTDYNTAKLLFSGSKTITHNDDGAKTITFSASLTKSSYSSYDPGKCELSGEFKLTDIPRASTIKPVSNYVTFNEIATINIARVEGYTDTLTWVGYIPTDNGDGSYSLYGEPSELSGTICEKTSLDSAEWEIPEELSSLIPTLRMVGAKVTCTTYNGEEIVGTSECWIFARLLEEIANPLINRSVEETNEKVINQLGTNDFSIPVLNVSQPKFTFSATPRYNATIKSIKVVCEDGQTSTTSPHTFNPIGNAKFSIVAVDSREYTTTIPIDLSADAIPYIKPTIKILEPTRLSPISGEIILNAKGDWYGGVMIDDIANPLNAGYKCKINGSEDEAILVDIPSSAIVLDGSKNEWSIKDYSLGVITEYNKNYNFTLFISDYYVEQGQSKIIRKGISTFNAGEKDFQVNGDLFVADEDGNNKTNILTKLNELNKNNNIGDLSELETTDKSNIVGAINEALNSGVEIESYSLGAKGYIKWKNGFLINWGTSSVTTTASTGNHIGSAVSFAKAFKTAVVFAGASRQGTNQHQYFPAINAYTLSTITAMMSTTYAYASTWTVRWFAIGY